MEIVLQIEINSITHGNGVWKRQRQQANENFQWNDRRKSTRKKVQHKAHEKYPWKTLQSMRYEKKKRKIKMVIKKMLLAVGNGIILASRE